MLDGAVVRCAREALHLASDGMTPTFFLHVTTIYDTSYYLHYHLSTPKKVVLR